MSYKSHVMQMLMAQGPHLESHGSRRSWPALSLGCILAPVGMCDFETPGIEAAQGPSRMNLLCNACPPTPPKASGQGLLPNFLVL